MVKYGDPINLGMALDLDSREIVVVNGIPYEAHNIVRDVTIFPITEEIEVKLTNKDILLAEIVLAMRDKKSLELHIKNSDMPKVEIITNPYENLEHKYNYIKEKYDNDLFLMGVNNPSIQIIKHITRESKLPLPNGLNFR